MTEKLKSAPCRAATCTSCLNSGNKSGVAATISGNLNDRGRKNQTRREKNLANNMDHVLVRLERLKSQNKKTGEVVASAESEASESDIGISGRIVAKAVGGGIQSEHQRY
jgi:hypothetical protein